VLIHRGFIQAVGASRQVLSLGAARDCREIDATGKVVVPAFVDPVVSLVQTRPSPRHLDRLLQIYDTADPGVFQEILKESAHACAALSSQTLKLRVRRAASGMLRHGTGTVASRAPYAFDDTFLMKILRLQHEQDGALQSVSTLFLKPPDDADAAAWTQYVCQNLMPKVRKRRLAAAIDLEYDSMSLPFPMASAILRCAAQLGFVVNVHAGPSSRGSAVPLGLSQDAYTVGGFRDISEDEIQSLAESPTMAIFKPGITFQTGMAFRTPGRAMLDAGVIPVLASAFHPELSPSYNMQLILLLAARLFGFKPEEAISAATINAAHALRLESSVGSIETGKQADMLILNVSDYRELAYYAGINVVDKVIKRGILAFDASEERRQ
jgi:imidazolonepropionase